MTARIYQLPKNAMQSGRARTRGWVLEHLPSEARHADPLMGWTGSGDTQVQVRLSFDSVEAACAYAKREGIDAHVIATPTRTLKIQTYAENFK
ncbi:MAG: ETC complex I subunit [Pseudomonadota bacterium]